MYQIKTMEKLEMMECPQCANPMPVKRRQLGYHVCVNCSTVSAKRGIPVMRGKGDHTWVDFYCCCSTYCFYYVLYRI